MKEKKSAKHLHPELSLQLDLRLTHKIRSNLELELDSNIDLEVYERIGLKVRTSFYSKMRSQLRRDLNESKKA